jgi:hypothetical protein
VNASGTVTVGGVPIGVDTTGYGADSISNVKTWVDARISIGTSATNGITEPHTFTVTVEKNAGDGNGWVAASGVTITPTSTGVGGITGGTCTTTVTDSNGQCTITINSATPGTETVNASGTVTVGGVPIGVDTTGYGADSISNQKTWVAGSLSWIKHDGLGNLLGGATFQVCATAGTAAGLTPLCVTVVDNGPFDADPVLGQFTLKPYQSLNGTLLGGLALGTYTIQETVAPAGFTLDPYIATVVIDQSHLNPPAGHIWVDTNSFQGCTPGFWKNHLSAWDQTTDPTVSKILPFLVSPFGYNAALLNFNNQPFFGYGSGAPPFPKAGIFGLPSGPFQGLSSSLTLIQL